MSKTIKELADELDVSKQTIQYHYQRLLAKDRQKDSRGFNIINPKADREIRGRIAKSFSKNRQRSSKEPTKTQQKGSKEKISENAHLIEQIEDLKQQRDQIFDSKEKELASKDRQIENLGKLLDQAQQLQLIAEQKIENQKKELLTMSTHKKGFWYKLFH